MSRTWFKRLLKHAPLNSDIALFAIALLALHRIAILRARRRRPLRRTSPRIFPPDRCRRRPPRACLECHEARIILQQRLSKAAWTKEVDKMTKWGAVVDPADRDALIDYLSTNFGPDKPAYEPQRTAGQERRKNIEVEELVRKKQSATDPMSRGCRTLRQRCHF